MPRTKAGKKLVMHPGGRANLQKACEGKGEELLNDRLLLALSLCRKAGALVTGFDAVCEELKRGRAFLLLFARDISEKTKARVEAHARNCPTYTLKKTQDEIAAVTVKPTGVLAVTNMDLAILCQKAL